MADDSTPRARVERLLGAARQLGDAASPASQALRSRLLETSGLSAAGIELALANSLETSATPAELDSLLAATPAAPRAHVLLSGNVFVAALRAIAVGLAASERVSVRASRRDPALSAALLELVPGLFELVNELTPQAGDHVWAYGSDETLASVKAALPAGVWLHRHGHGVGVVVVELGADAHQGLARLARSIALDTALFDQRGCLSPRAVCVAGSIAHGQGLAQALAGQLAEIEREVPLGSRSAAERAEARRERDSAAYAFELLDAGSSWVSLADRLVFPAGARNLHVVATPDPIATLAPFSAHLTCIGAQVSPSWAERLRLAFPGARLVAPGEMQRPPLDGPVDQRSTPELT